MDDKLKTARITSKTVDVLYQGLKACWPNYFYGKYYSPLKHKTGPSWNNLDRNTIRQIVIKVAYPSTDFSSSVEIIKSLHNDIERGIPPKTNIPPEINKLVEDVDKHIKITTIEKDREIKLAGQSENAPSKSEAYIASAEERIEKERNTQAEKIKIQEETTVTESIYKEELSKNREIKKEVKTTPKPKEEIITESKTQEQQEFFIENKEEPEVITLTPPQVALVEMAQTNSEAFSADIKGKIVNAQKESGSQANKAVEQVVDDLTNKFKQIPDGENTIALSNPHSILKSIGEEHDVSDSTDVISGAIKHDSNIAAGYLGPVIGQGFANKLYPTKESGEVNITKQKTPNSYASYNLRRLYDELNIRSKEKGAKLTKEETHKRNVVINALTYRFTGLGRYPSGGITPSGSPGFSMPSHIGGSSVSNMIISSTIDFSLDKILTKIPISGKINTTLAGFGSKVLGKAATKTASKAVASTAAKFGLKAIFKGISTAIGNVAGWIASEVVSRVITFLNKHKEKVAYAIGGALMLSGLAFGAPLLAVAGIPVALGGVAMQAGGLAAAGAAAAGAVQAGIAGLIGIVLSAIGIPIVIALISFPLVVVFILFIINSSAYLVPPGSGTLSSEGTIIESPYIRITFSPLAQDAFENSDLPLTVSYSITVSATQGTLTNVSVDYNTAVIQDNTASESPNINPTDLATSNAPDTIEPQNPYTFTYEQEYPASQYEDSLITNIVTVRATSPDGPAQSATSTSISIGEPVADCPYGWPVSPERGETSLVLTQGPHAGTHSPSLEAIDVGTTVGHTVKATHSGVVFVYYTTGAYRPLFIDIHSVCNGKSFFSRYAHLSVSRVADGQTVNIGEPIGLTGTNGTGPHLHYEFQGLKMNVPYIPEYVPYGCLSNCGFIK